jgi:hypothetical protein
MSVLLRDLAFLGIAYGAGLAWWEVCVFFRGEHWTWADAGKGFIWPWLWLKQHRGWRW